MSTGKVLKMSQMSEVEDSKQNEIPKQMDPNNSLKRYLYVNAESDTFLSKFFNIFWSTSFLLGTTFKEKQDVFCH